MTGPRRSSAGPSGLSGASCGLALALALAGCRGATADRRGPPETPPAGAAARPARPAGPDGGPGLAAAAAPDAAVASGGARPPRSPAEALHHGAVVVDAHCDVTLRLADEPGFDLGARHEDGHLDLPRMREGGLDAELLAIWVNPSRFQGEEAWRRSLAMLEAVERAASQPGAVLARSAAEVRRAEAEGRAALLVGLEGAHGLGDCEDEAVVLERIGLLAARGLRSFGLTWMRSNPLAGSSGDRGAGRGLSPLGRRAIALANDLGLVVDLSHASDRAAREAVRASRLPVLASHSAARALSRHPRNLPDPLIREVAARGGAVCVNFFPGFLDAAWGRARRRARLAGLPFAEEPPPLALLVDHVEHVARVAGPEAVCMGSDFDGIGALPAGMRDVTSLPEITAELVRRGHGDEAIRAFLGGNFLRVLEASEAGARPGP